jgi:Leishmanolysin
MPFGLAFFIHLFNPLQKGFSLLLISFAGHALGFNAISMAYFRRPDGTPITPRNASGAIPETLVECTGPTFGQQLLQPQQKVSATQAPPTNSSSTIVGSGNISIAGNTSDLQLAPQRGGGQQDPSLPPPVTTGLTAMLPLPSTEILQFRTVRGGVRVAEVVTPSVQQVVRNHFDCQELPGAELESGEFLPLSTSPGEVSCLGDHWERRLFKSDLMNPVVDALEFNPRFSTITLAYFADSGWYQVDLSRASLAPSWGRGSGCGFVEERCLDQDGQVAQRFDSMFCNNAPRVSQPGFAADIDGCTPDLLRKAACSMGQYAGEIPAQYQYFNGTYGSNIGGSDPFMDYCVSE